MGWRKKRELLSKFETLIAVCEQATSIFDHTFSQYLLNSHDGQFLFGIDSIHKCKNESNICVEGVRTALYSSSFPTVRDELMVVARSIDLIVEDIAHVFYHIHNHSLETSIYSLDIYSTLKEQVKECIVSTIALCHQFTLQTVDRSIISEFVVVVSAKKDLANRTEDEIIKSLFSSAPSGEIKLEQSEIVSKLTQITQRCMRLSNQIEILILTENE